MLWDCGGGDTDSARVSCSEFVANEAVVIYPSGTFGGSFGASTEPAGGGLNSHTSCPLLDTTPKCPSFGGSEFTEGMRSWPADCVSASGLLGGGDLLPVRDRERVSDEPAVCNGAGYAPGEISPGCCDCCCEDNVESDVISVSESGFCCASDLVLSIFSFPPKCSRLYGY